MAAMNGHTNGVNGVMNGHENGALNGHGPEVVKKLKTGMYTYFFLL